jgi:hypothetical protein
MISVPSGGLVPKLNPNQSVMNMFGVPKYTVNKNNDYSKAEYTNTQQDLPDKSYLYTFKAFG